MKPDEIADIRVGGMDGSNPTYVAFVDASPGMIKCAEAIQERLAVRLVV